MKTTIREHRWKVAEDSDREAVARLAKEINVPNAIAGILVRRGIDTYDRAKAYFRPNMDLLHDPFLMDGMEVATSRIIDALGRKERILVFGDYDVDGTNGAAMLSLFLTELGGNVEFYIPDRIIEGYGISQTGIDRARDSNASLFLAVDCGITAVEQVKYARSFGLDVIICDHHEPGEVLPDAFAVLDPIKRDDPYPFKNLCGCGVGFKLIQGLAKKLGKEDLLPSYLDFVTLATTADIVPLVGENRVLTKLGLELINTNPRPGIKALIESAGLKDREITTGHIVFALAPRINAVGRLGDAMRAVRLLTCTDPVEASQLAQVLEEENRKRRKIDEETFEQARELVDHTINLQDSSAIVLHREHWHPGVIGIVASRMVEKYYKPSIMLATVDGVAKGSAHSVSGFDIHKALKKCEDKLIQFGGHKYAAGLTVELDRLDEFRESFDAVVRESMTDEMKTPELRIDTEVQLNDLTPRFIRILKEFAPFGPSNMRPLFLARNMDVHGQSRIAGKNHLRFKVKQNGSLFDAIGFGLGELLPRVSPGRKNLDVVFSIDESDWNTASGAQQRDAMPQLKVRDLR